jgi:hypothetical protein
MGLHPPALTSILPSFPLRFEVAQFDVHDARVTPGLAAVSGFQNQEFSRNTINFDWGVQLHKHRRLLALTGNKIDNCADVRRLPAEPARRHFVATGKDEPITRTD